MDGELTARAAGGDVNAFIDLVRPRQAALRAFCARLSADKDAADDLAQEVLLAAFESFGSFDPSRDLGVWLRGIARNKARMAWREEKTRRHALDELLRREAERRLGPDEDTSESLLVALKACVSYLSSRNRRLLDLFYCEGVPGRRLAKELRMSAEAFYTALARIRQFLRRCVTERVEEEWA